MATDYDAPRIKDEGEGLESIQELQAGQLSGAKTAVLELDETDAAEGFELPGADLSHEELNIQVIPVQADEFTCMSCFLVRHRTQLAREKNGSKYCRDCEA
jgi:hypothetical protein